MRIVRKRCFISIFLLMAWPYKKNEYYNNKFTAVLGCKHPHLPMEVRRQPKSRGSSELHVGTKKGGHFVCFVFLFSFEDFWVISSQRKHWLKPYGWGEGKLKSIRSAKDLTKKYHFFFGGVFFVPPWPRTQGGILDGKTVKKTDFFFLPHKGRGT